MARTHSSIALDSEEALRKAVGPDATAGFETDPNFIPSDPTSTASSENIALQRDTDDTADSDEEETEAEDLDEQDEDDQLDDEEDEDDEEEDDDDVEEDDDANDVDPGLDEDDDLDTDQVTDAALSLNPYLRIAPATSARATHHA